MKLHPLDLCANDSQIPVTNVKDLGQQLTAKFLDIRLISRRFMRHVQPDPWVMSEIHVYVRQLGHGVTIETVQ